MPVEQPAVTQRDIAKHCGLSVMTVSLALRDDGGRLKRETVEKVRTAASLLGYDPSRSLGARRLRYARAERQVVNQLVAFYFSVRHVQGAYFVHLLHGLGDVLDQADFSLLTNWMRPEQNLPPRLPAIFGRGEVDGVLTLSGVPNIDQAIRMLRADPGFGSRPIVSLMEQEADGSCVLTDDVGGGHALMSHLLDLGHRQVLCVEFSRWQHVQRLEGCRLACLEHNLAPEQAIIGLPYKSDNPEFSRASLLDSLANHPGCQAIFAGNDFTACLIADWLRQAGRRIPQDVSLVGFDDTHTLNAPNQVENLLTTVRLPLEDVGRRGATLLLDRIRGRVTEDRTITLPVELVVRGSTAAPTAPARQRPTKGRQ